MSLSLDDKDDGEASLERADSEQTLEGPVKGARNWKSWVRSHPWTVGAIVLLVACCLVAIIVAPICATGHCGGSSSSSTEDDSGSLTLILKFTDAQIDALQVVPAVLRQFTDRLHLNSSSLQLLTFSEEAVLQEARKYLQAHPNLELLVRDFAMRVIQPQQQALDDTLLQSILNVYAPGTYVPDAAQQATDLAAAQAAAARLNLTLTSGSGRRSLNQALGTPITPNDPYFAQQWFHPVIKTPAAWAATTGAPTIIVAVIDTGTDLTHPDLINNLWVNTKEIPNNGIDDDGNGYIDDYYGYDFAGGCLNNAMNTQGFCIKCVGQPNPSPFPTRDTSPHGTHVAGLIAAVQNNAIGVSGVAPNVRIMSLKVDNCVQSAGFSTASIVTAFDYAIKMGAHIVSCSFGPLIYNYNFPTSPANVSGSYWYDPNQAKQTATYLNALAPLSAKGVLVVAAAGNEFTNMDHYTDMGFFYGPCNTPLPNVICVGASGPNDAILTFSNFGNATVDIAAPGQSIYSTWLQSSGQAYGTYSGTSQATPIVTGIAALVLSTLSSVDGTMFRAPQLKSILMSSGDYVPTLVTTTVSGSRVNAAGAVQAAMRANSLIGLMSIGPSTFSPALTSLMSGGLSETYFSSSKAGIFITTGLTVLDTSVRAGPSTSYPTFKYGTGTLLYSNAMMYMATAGVYGLQVTTTLSPSSYSVAVGGVTLNITNGLAVFSATAVGYYPFELYVSNPTSSVTINWKTPGFTTYGPLSVFYIATLTTSGPPAFAQNLALASGFQVFYNASTAAVAPSSLRTLTATTNFANTAIVADLAFAGGAFKAALFPAGSSAPAVIGVATTLLVPSTLALPGPVKFTVTCIGCSLTLNDLLLIDNWDSTQAGGSPVKTSGCVNLTSSQYTLAVQFASNSLAAAPLQLTMGGCATGSVSSSLAAATSTPLFWQPASDTAGYIGGLQCDVWRNATFGVNGSAPTFKVRLPKASSVNELMSDNTSMPFSFTLDSILPGLAASYPASRGGLFAVRCWTYWSTVPTAAQLTAPVSVATMTSNIYLAGRKVGGAGSVLMAAPATSQLAGNLQLLAVEWTKVTSTATLALLRSGTPVTIDLSTMTLPLQIVPSQSNLVGTQGGYSVAYQPTGVDVPALVQTDMAEFPTAGYVTTNNYGLSNNVSFSRTLRNKARYARSDGYFVLSLLYDANYTIQVSEIAMQSSTVLMGNVTVKNGAPFAGTNTVATVYTFQAFLPVHPGPVARDLYFAYMAMIVKSMTPDGDANFDMDLLLPVDDAGAMNTQVWFRTAAAPLN